jgi:hypothetical protein
VTTKPGTALRRRNGVLHTADCDYELCRGECADLLTHFTPSGKRVANRPRKSAPVAGEGLDVERLARALPEGWEHRPAKYWRQLAERIAARYEGRPVVDE